MVTKLENNQKIIIFEDYGNVKAELFMAPDGVDIDAAFHKAVDAAKNAGEAGLKSGLPQKYLFQAGLTRVDILVSYINDDNIGLTSSEKAGIFRPECRYCDDFDEGVCSKYGGICDPSKEEDCITNAYKISLCYGKKVVQDFVILGEPLTPAEIAENVKGDYESIRNIMSQPNYDGSMWIYS